MKRLLRSALVSDIGLVRGLLERAGIECFTKNEQLAGALGDIPFLECEPELWIIHDADLSRAQIIVAAHMAPASTTEQWRCTHCGEIIDGQFEACWQCGSLDQRP